MSSRPPSLPPPATASVPAENMGLESDPIPGSGQWVFAGWGSAQRITNLDETSVSSARPQKSAHKLGEWSATAICGNDITSSVLYVSALCTLAAGIYAPIALAAVGLVLYLFRKIYAEVGSALPLNGGAYNVLLNTSSKAKASLAACLTLLSYTATAVISSGEALHYAHAILPVLPIMAGTIGLLGLFACLSLLGITESAVVALVIFILHIGTLTLLVGTSFVHVYQNGFSILIENWSLPSPRGLGHALFFGFAAGMLGISGFESSANFIEEQKAGVFPKTLRNMWIAVTVFNPLISLLALGTLHLNEFSEHQQALLSVRASCSAPSCSPAG